MTAQELVERCKTRGVELFLKPGGEMGVRADRSLLTEKLLDTLRTHKAEIIPLLAVGQEEASNDENLATADPEDFGGAFDVAPADSSPPVISWRGLVEAKVVVEGKVFIGQGNSSASALSALKCWGIAAGNETVTRLVDQERATNGLPPVVLLGRNKDGSPLIRFDLSLSAAEQDAWVEKLRDVLPGLTR